MIIGKVTTQNSGVRINLNMFWMQMEYNWLFSERLSRSRSEQNGWENAFVISRKRAMQTYYCDVCAFLSPFLFPSLSIGLPLKWSWGGSWLVGKTILKTVFKMNETNDPFEQGGFNFICSPTHTPNWFNWIEMSITGLETVNNNWLKS